MKVHDLHPAPGSTGARRRVGRGIGGKGGQLPLAQRVPKLKGFKNPFRVEYVVVNLDTIEAIDSDRGTVTPESLRAAGLVHKHGLVKVLGRGELTRRVTVSAHAFSRSAVQAIEAAGGRVEVLAPPFGRGRPPAKGNALTNR